MKGFDLVLDNNDLKIFFVNFEQALDRMSVIKFSEKYIEFSGMIIFSKKGERISQILNPGMDILTVEKEDFKLMIELIEEKQGDDFLIIRNSLKPKGVFVFNLKKIKDGLIFYKEDPSFVVVNDMLFTTDSFEFHGSAFSGRKNTYLLSDENLSILKEYLNF